MMGHFYLCTHPDHDITTDLQCARCGDYCFPYLTMVTPVSAVKSLLLQGPRPQPFGWWQWPNVQEAYRQLAQEHLTSSLPEPPQQDGRGVVIVGGGKYFPAAYVTIRVLRRVGCPLPIELWHLSGEIDGAASELLKPWSVTCVDGEALSTQRPFRFLTDHWWKGWQLKAYALLNCRFNEVLLLDADSYPTRDPTFLFDWAPYREYGAVFWPDPCDLEPLAIANKVAVFGVIPQDDRLTESGQILVDKRRCWRELSLAAHYNAHADFTYRFIWGDKDTFPLAWWQLGTRYARMWPTCDVGPHGVSQLDADGNVLFQHRCLDKFVLNSTEFHSTPQPFTQNRRYEYLIHEDFCFQVLQELAAACGPLTTAACQVD
jgi:hypothetical protein